MVIGIIGAMEVEVENLKADLANLQVTHLAGLDFASGELGGVPVVVVRSGVGKVNAALCTQVLIDHFGVTHVINTGIAGSLDSRLEIGDFVVSVDACHHDMDLTPLGFEPGVIMAHPTSFFVADEGLRAAAVRAIEAQGGRVIEGRIASGDQFVASAEQKTRILSTVGGACCEMEGAAIAHVCVSNSVPYVVIRAISDNANGDSPADFVAWEERVAHICSYCVEQMVASLKS